MGLPISRRGLLQALAAAPAVPLLQAPASAGPFGAHARTAGGWIVGKLTGAHATAVALLRPAVKAVYAVRHVGEIPGAVQQAFACARSGEPGPAAVVIPYNLFLDAHDFRVPPPPEPELPWDEAAAAQALALLADRRLRVGIYAGLGCMDYAAALAQVAELLQAPVATSVSGKGAIPESHPLAVGWGYGPQGTRTAERAF